jgi:MFS family permease
MTTTDKAPVLDHQAPPAQELPPLWPVATVMATGIFATTFVQLQSLGNYPFQHLLMKDMGMNTIVAGAFINIATLPWSLKPLAGLLIDGFPLFGTRRRWYLLLSAAAACAFWLVMSFMPARYYPLLLAAFAMNVAIVFGSVASGGLLVEAGQRYGVTGRLSSLRVGAQNLAASIGYLLGGLLAAGTLIYTGLVAVVPLSLLFVATLVLLREPVRTTRDADFWSSIWHQFKNILRWRMLWAAALLFFIQAVPNLSNPVQLDYQSNILGFSDEFLGVMTCIAYLIAIGGPAVYASMCRRLPLRWSLYVGCILVAASALPYLGYGPGLGKTAAIVIESSGMLLMYMGFMPLFDLAVRATPKGSEALGYSLLISIWNIGLTCSNQVGPMLYEWVFRKRWDGLVWLNAGVTLFAILIVLFLPRGLVDRSEGHA